MDGEKKMCSSCCVWAEFIKKHLISRTNDEEIILVEEKFEQVVVW